MTRSAFIVNAKSYTLSADYIIESLQRDWGVKFIKTFVIQPDSTSMSLIPVGGGVAVHVMPDIGDLYFETPLLLIHLSKKKVRKETRTPNPSSGDYGVLRSLLDEQDSAAIDREERENEGVRNEAEGGEAETDNVRLPVEPDQETFAPANAETFANSDNSAVSQNDLSSSEDNAEQDAPEGQEGEAVEEPQDEPEEEELYESPEETIDELEQDQDTPLRKDLKSKSAGDYTMTQLKSLFKKINNNRTTYKTTKQMYNYLKDQITLPNGQPVFSEPFLRQLIVFGAIIKSKNKAKDIKPEDRDTKINKWAAANFDGKIVKKVIAKTAEGKKVKKCIAEGMPEINV